MADENRVENDTNNDANSDCSEECYTIEELNDMYDNANAVLGGSDPNNCSYSLGYAKRQALYACVTCNGPHIPNSEMAGVCLACANKCHENHQLVELYTKRNFRCDCGNKKFPIPCNLLPEKEAKNPGNSYNHNFHGLYCTCERPYPDLERPEDDDEMIQCIVCEDWFHSRHAFGHHADKLIMGDGKDVDSEMICTKCTQSCDFLGYYENLRVPVRLKTELSTAEGESKANVTVSGEENEKVEAAVAEIPAEGKSNSSSAEECLKLAEKRKLEAESDEKTKELKAEIDVESRISTGGSSPLPALSTAETTNDNCSQETKDSGIVLNDAGEGSSTSCDNGSCLLKGQPKVKLPETATLWIAGWRSKLCKCESCINMYFKLGVGFITDEDDTLFAYEAIGQAKIEEEEKEDEEKFTNMWSKLDHVTQVEAMIGINEMKEHLREFLQKHSGKIVRRRDAEEFAEELKAKRARRMNGDGIPPNNCG